MRCRSTWFRVHTEFWTHSSRTFPGHFQDNLSFTRTFHNCRNEMARKAPSNKDGGLGGSLSLPSGPGQSPGGGAGGKVPGSSLNPLFHSTWRRAENPQFSCVLQYKNTGQINWNCNPLLMRSLWDWLWMWLAHGRNILSKSLVKII